MPTISIFHKDISVWFILAAAAILGVGGYFLWKHHEKEGKAKKDKANKKIAEAGATKVEEPKTHRATLYVPGAGQVLVNVPN